MHLVIRMDVRACAGVLVCICLCELVGTHSDTNLTILTAT